jgi:hypothetical protein
MGFQLQVSHGLWKEKSIGVLDEHSHFLGDFPQFDLTHTDLGKVIEMM